MSALLRVNTLELMKLWGELVEAYHGKNGYGGNVAEIYSYRFVADQYAQQDAHKQSRDALGELCLLFEQEYCCSIKIDGLPISEWRQAMKEGFDWRCLVEVLKRNKR